MRKLKLNLEDLKVESFETTTESSDARGTVFGYSTTGNQIDCGCDTTPDTCDLNFCGGGGGGGDSTNESTCATGSQIICECGG